MRAPSKKQRELSESLYRRREAEAAAASYRRSNTATANPEIPVGLEIQRQPPKPDRYAPEPGFVGELSRLRIGEYAAEPSTCAARAA